MRWIERLFRDAKLGMTIRHQGYPWRLVAISIDERFLRFEFIRGDKGNYEDA